MTAVPNKVDLTGIEYDEEMVDAGCASVIKEGSDNGGAKDTAMHSKLAAIEIKKPEPEHKRPTQGTPKRAQKMLAEVVEKYANTPPKPKLSSSSIKGQGKRQLEDQDDSPTTVRVAKKPKAKPVPA
jgi:hypothetical protein